MRRLQARHARNDFEATEVSKYLNSPLVPLMRGDPLPWWKDNADEFPTLARMARDILSIPLTSVSVERIFSSARDVIPYRRNRLSGKMVERLLIAKSWHQNQTHGNTPTAESDDHEHSDTEILAMNILDSEFLQQMVPQDCLTSDEENSASDTELDTDMGSDIDELHTSFLRESLSMDQSSTLAPRKRKSKEIPVIQTPLSGRLRKHARKNYGV